MYPPALLQNPQRVRSAASSEVSSERSLRPALALANAAFVPGRAQAPLLSLCVASCLCLHGTWEYGQCFS